MTAAYTGRPFWFSTFDQFMNKCITTQWAKTVIRVVWVAQCLIKKPSGCGDPNVYFVSMSILKVARMGHPVLRKRTVPLSPTELNGSEIQQLIDDMFETMQEYEGIGLAAPQVHHSVRLFVAGVDDSDSSFSPIVMVNPEIEVIGRDVGEDWEGCLSIPDVRGKVPRSQDIRVRSLDRHGQPQQMTASGFPARVVQHETDHLDGILFLDRMSSLESLTFLDEYGRYGDKESSES